MNYNNLPVLETDRLRLRPVTIDDAQDIYAYAQDPRVSELLAWEPSASIESTRTMVENWIANCRANKQAPWAIVDKKMNTVIGTIDVRHYDSIKHSAVVGYCLSAEHWGKGYMPEALRAVLEYVFTQTDIRSVAATCRVDNPQSIRVLEKVGMRKQVDKTERLEMKGQEVELDRFVVLKDEYLKNK